MDIITPLVIIELDKLFKFKNVDDSHNINHALCIYKHGI